MNGIRPFRHLKPDRSFLLFVVFILFGCAAVDPSIAEPTVTSTSAVVPTATSRPTATNTLPPPVISEVVLPTASPTEVPPQPTMTAVPSETPPSTKTMVPTVAIEQEYAIEDGCRPLNETVNYKNYYRIADQFPPHTPQSTIVYAGFSNGMKIIHLGFDVEREPDALGALLNVLDRRQVTATMFILGSWAEVYPEWVRKIADRGHELANHAWSHEDVARMDLESFEEEVDLTEAFVKELTGKSTKPFFRPPFGSWSDETVSAAYAKGYSTVLWTGSAEDWRSGTNVEVMCKTMMVNSYAGGIIYAHTWHPDTPEVIDRFIGEMQAQGYTFVPLSVILSSNPQDYLIPNH